ncbi:MAG: zinc ribbon domain-containing protein [Thermodesulfovibrio sp.]|nr:zinc ribbon domain-containing protein [Thermodesulfovibrio sp.]
MPLYEYKCKKCERTFQVLKPVSKRDDTEKCPHCGSNESERLISPFMSNTTTCSFNVYSGG